MSHDARSTAPRSDAELVAGLVGDLAPVRPVRLASVVAQTVLLEVAVALVTAWLLGARIVGSERLGDPSFVLLLLILAAGGALSAFAMSALSIPGRTVPSLVRTLVLALPLLLAALVVAVSPWGSNWKGLVAVFVEGFHCTQNSLMVAAPAWLAGLLRLRRLGPLDPVRVGLFAAFTALLAAALAVQMACASCDSWHLAISHYVPLLLAAWLGALLAPLVLRR